MSECPEEMQAQFFCAESKLRMAFMGCNCDGAEKLAMHLGMIPKRVEGDYDVECPWCGKMGVESPGYDDPSDTRCRYCHGLVNVATFNVYEAKKVKDIPPAENTGIVRRKDLEPGQEETGR